MLVAENFYKNLSELSYSVRPKFLLAVSGGPDSMCLAHLFSEQTDYEFSIAHCNYNLRGAESIAEQSLIEEYCNKTGIKFHLKSFNQNDFKSYKDKGTQEAARIMRFDFFKELINKFGYTHIVTAHHQNDNVETFIFNLIRGAGINGLSGLKTLSENKFKPLLDVSKTEIIEYNKANKIPYLTDSSNSSNKYSRNKIRNQIIPLFEEINPEAVTHILNTTSHLKKFQSFIEKQANSFKEKHIQDSEYFLKIDLIELLKTDFKTEILFEYVKDYGFTFHQLDQIINSNEPGRKIVSVESELYFDNHSITLLKKNIERIQVEIDQLPFSISTAFGIIEIKEVDVPSNFKEDKNLYLDSDILIGKKLTIRSIEKSDRFNPLGLKGSQLASDFFINSKISIPFRKASLVLLTGEEIAGLIPYRISEKFKITTSTKSAIRISIK